MSTTFSVTSPVVRPVLICTINALVSRRVCLRAEGINCVKECNLKKVRPFTLICPFQPSIYKEGEKLH